MLGGDLDDAEGAPPTAVAGEESGVLHALHLGAGFGVDDGDDFVGVGAVPVFEFAEGLEGDVEVALADVGMRGEGEDVDLHGAERGEIGAVGDDEVGAGGEGEVVDVFAVEADGLGVVGVAGFAGGDAGGSDHVAVRDGEVDVVGAEVGEELGGGVVLVAVPCAVPEDAGLGEPLTTHDEVALVAVAGDGEGELVVEGEAEGDGVVGGERAGEGDLGYGVVEEVAVVGGDEVEGGGEVAVGVGFDVGDGDAA